MIGLQLTCFHMFSVDIDSLLDNSEYMRDLKGEIQNDNSCSDHTATSSLTIGSEKPEGTGFLLPCVPEKSIQCFLSPVRRI